ncbi:MAG: replicative DNA helicase [Flavobacteriales bacterium]|nr:replicative DNA helicase [Flavobacteriales bacterium]
MDSMRDLMGKDTSKRLKKSTLPSTMEIGKIPPQAIDLEEAVLGAMMLEKEAVNDVIDILKPESFYKETHKMIYEAIMFLFHSSQPIDILTVTQQLKAVGKLDIVGGAYYISQLTNRVASSANVEYHARIISQKFILRELIRISGETIKDAYDETSDVFGLLNRAEQDLFGIAQGHLKGSSESMNKLIKNAIDHIQDVANKPSGISGVETGFRDLDRLTSGFQPSDMIVLAARPGMGKTAFVLSLARNTAVEFKKGVAIFSLEMSALQLVNRLIASETELSQEKLKKGKLEPHEWEQLHSKIDRLSDAPIFIDDTAALSVFELRAKCRRLKSQFDIQMVIIDYLQLMTTGSSEGNREQEISMISRSIKSIAKELGVPIIALSQLSRAVETRGGEKRPMLSDLRESGAIEQDADMVMFIYRPAYYGITEDEDGMPTDDLGELIVAKHRNGSLDTVKMRFIANLAKFTDREEFGGEGFGAVGVANTDFDDMGGGRIMGSKMNDDDEAPF